MKNISRRDFLKSAAAGAAGIGLMSVGLVGCSSSSSAETETETDEAAEEVAEEVVEEAAEEAAAETASTEATQITETVYSSASWRIKPDPIDESEIIETYDVDVCVVGLGHSGAAAAIELSEEGYTVIAIEKKAEEVFTTTGTDIGHINSALSESLGGGSGYDPIEFFNNWMLNTANAANPTLAMKFAQNCGEAVDWWAEKGGDDIEPTLVFEGPNDERPNIVTEVGPFHFYCSSVNFNDAVCITNSKDSVEADGVSKFLFGCTGEQLLTDDDGNVTGVVAQNADGEYFQVNCQAVIIATGGFGGNTEMANDLLVDLKYVLQDNDNFNGMGMDSNGDGIRMAYWVGGRLEQNPGTMDGKATWQTSSPALVPMLSHPQGIHLDYTGRRFYNEYWGPIEMRSRPLMTRNRELFYCVYDDNLTTYMQYVPASHGTTDPTEETLAGVREILDAAYAVKGTGYTDETSQSVWYAGDSIEECIEAIGIEDERVANNIIASVESWNACCEAGADSEYGREDTFLFPINQGPYYIQVNENNEILGNFLTTVGALITDGDQRVLGEDWKPITGLFATGNATGGRFGWDYFSPAYGVSVGIALTLGREAGKSVGQYLNGELV